MVTTFGECSLFSCCAGQFEVVNILHGARDNRFPWQDGGNEWGPLNILTCFPERLEMGVTGPNCGIMAVLVPETGALPIRCNFHCVTFWSTAHSDCIVLRMFVANQSVTFTSNILLD